MSVAEFVRRRTWGAQVWFLILGLGLLWLVLRRVEWFELRQALAVLDPLRLLPLVGINVLILIAFNVRWWLFLRAQGYAPPFWALFRYRLAAFGVSYFTPGPHTGGEPLQILLVQRKHNVPTDAALAAVALDKIFDIFFNFSFLLISLIMMLRSTLLADQIGPRSLVYLLLWPLLLAGLLVAYRHGSHPIGWLLQWGRTQVRQIAALKTLRNSERMASFFTALYSGTLRSEARMATLCQNREGLLVKALLVSAGTWGLLIAEFWLATHVLALDLDLMQTIFVMAAMRVAILLPLPAGIGVLEAGLVWAVQGIGLNAGAGIALAGLIRVRDVGLGIWGLWLAGRYWPKGRVERA